jgi:hypothetical protein
MQNYRIAGIFLLAVSIVVSYRQSHRYGGMLGNNSAGSCVLWYELPYLLQAELLGGKIAASVEPGGPSTTEIVNTPDAWHLSKTNYVLRLYDSALHCPEA